ncbi:MAG TPA: DUF1761 domain-containing protein [Saprospiraceae bacterium]|nr:DUF1761 domain-containing protein [Saprospiraceae bacterium]
MPQPNLLAIVIAALIPMFMGFIYYHPKVFGKVWMDSLGLKEEDLKKGNMGVILGISLVMSILLSMFMLVNVDGPGQEGEFDSFKHGVFHGVLVGIMVAMPVLVTNGLFERKNLKNLAINTLYWIITIGLMGGVIDMLNHWPNEAPAM